MISLLRSAAIAFAMATPVAIQTPVIAQELPQEEVERIVREYLMREPEVIYEAIQEFQRRQEEVESERQQELLASRADDIFNDPRDAVINDDGDVVLVEFFDYRCGYCRSMTDDLEQLIRSDTKLRFVFKEYPVLGEESMIPAKAALAARMQDGYEAMHFAMMRERDLSLDAILQIASDQGLDPDRLAKDMESEEVAQHIADNTQLARSLGFNGTPSFIIDDVLIPGALPVDQLASFVAEKRGG